MNLSVTSGVSPLASVVYRDNRMRHFLCFCCGKTTRDETSDCEIVVLWAGSANRTGQVQMLQRPDKLSPGCCRVASAV